MQDIFLPGIWGYSFMGKRVYINLAESIEGYLGEDGGVDTQFMSRNKIYKIQN